MDSVMRQFGMPSLESRAGDLPGLLQPRLDIAEHDSEYVISVEVPGSRRKTSLSPWMIIVWSLKVKSARRAIVKIISSIVSSAPMVGSSAYWICLGMPRTRISKPLSRMGF